MTEPSPERPSSVQPVQYKGEDLDPERGPGLGCFYLQMIVLGVLLVATPLSVSMGAASWVSAILLFATLGLLLVSGQTIIFLLRLVAADRREGRRRPLASGTRTVGELEDVHAAPSVPTDEGATAESAAPAPGASEPAPPPPSDGGPVRQ